MAFADQPPKRDGASLIPEENARRPAYAVPPRPLSLDDCYRLAVAQSDSLGLREQDIKLAQARYWATLGLILPNVRFLADQEFRDVDGGGSNGSGSGGFNPDSAGSFSGGRSASFDGRFNLSMPLFRGFRDFYDLAADQADIERTRLTRQRAFQSLYLDVADVYFQILRDDADLQVLARLVEALEDRVEDLEKRIRLGKSRRSEVLQAQTELADAKVIIERVKGVLGASRELMAFLTGMESQHVHLAPPPEALPSADALEAYLREAEFRPDVMALIAAERAAVKRLSAARAYRWPELSLETNWYAIQDPKSSRDWDVLLRLDVPIFDLTIEARVMERKALVRQSELNLSELRRAASREVRIAYNDFNAAIAEYLRLQDTIAFANENYAAQKEDFQLGRANNLDVLVALQRLQESYRQLVSAAAGARATMVRLHVSSGRFLQDPREPEAPDSALGERVREENRIRSTGPPGPRLPPKAMPPGN